MSSHSTVGPTSAPNHVLSGPDSPSPRAGSIVSQPTAHSPAPEPGRVVPDHKLSGDEGKIVPSPRIGATPPAQEHEPKAAEPDLRRRICETGPCKEAPLPPLAADSELRRRICKDGPCKEGPGPPAAANPDLRRVCKDGPCVVCPPGQSQDKNGKCVAPTPVFQQCQPNETWTGAACVVTNSCPSNEFWNGAQCVGRMNECVSIDARAGMLAHEVRTAKMDMQTPCSNNPSGQQCRELKHSYDFAVQRYRVLMNEAPVACRSMLLDPLSL